MTDLFTRDTKLPQQALVKAAVVGVKRKARGLVDHTPLMAIVDQRGVLRFAYIGPSPDVKLVLKDVRFLLADR